MNGTGFANRTGMYGLFDISASGMAAARVRMDVAAANIANQDALRDSSGKVNPYRRREVMLAPGMKGEGLDGANGAQGAGGTRSFGVHVAEISIDRSTPQPAEYDPGNPNAYTSGPYKGWVATTGVNPIVEQVNAMEAARAYEANVMSAETTKQMIAASLRLLA